MYWQAVRMKIQPKAGAEEGWLEPDEIYPVLGISISRDKIYFRVYSSSQNTPALFPATNFNVIDPNVPSGWVASMSADGIALEIEPLAWAEDNFWGAYFDDDQSAVAKFKAGYEVLINE